MGDKFKQIQFDAESLELEDSQDTFDFDEAWQGMPEFNQEDKDYYK